MKRLLVPISLMVGLSTTIVAQNVGINTTTPQSKLDVNGDMALRAGNISLTATMSNNIDLATNAYSFYNVYATGFKSISGFAGGKDGRIITLHNATVNAITFLDTSAGSLPVNQIDIAGDGPLSLLGGGSITLVYNSTASKWNITSSTNTYTPQANQWNTNGNTNTSTTNSFVGTIDSADLVFKTANTENLRIGATGNIGIGTTTPTERLVVKTKSNSYGITHTDGTTKVGTYVDATSGQLGTYTNHALGFFTNSSGQQITLLQNGNVGIGTTAPQTQLHVSPIAAGSILLGKNKFSGGYTNLEMGISAQSDGYGYVQATKSSGASYGNLNLNPAGGKVGVGTNVPHAMLDVHGGIALPIKVVTSDYTVQDGDYTIVVNMRGSLKYDVNIYLPNTFINTGRIIKIVVDSIGLNKSSPAINYSPYGNVRIFDSGGTIEFETLYLHTFYDAHSNSYNITKISNLYDKKLGATLQCVGVSPGWYVTDEMADYNYYEDTYTTNN